MRLFIVILLNISFFRVFACDFCSGSSLGLDGNMLSSNNGNSIGLHFSSRQFKLFGEGEYTGEKSWLFGWTLNGSYKPHEKVQIKAFLPLLLQVNDVDKNQAGLGDLLILSTYQPLNKMGEKHKVQHQLYLSGGLELPTGLDNSDLERITTIPFSSKSVDVILGTSYAMSVKRYILSTSVLSKLNTPNKRDYRYGHTFETALQNSIRIDIKDAQLFPFVGAKHYWQQSDVSNGFTRIYTGGHVISEMMGAQLNYYQHKVGFQVELPIYQQQKSRESKAGNSYTIQYNYQF
jgi:hypothetical protein